MVRPKGEKGEVPKGKGADPEGAAFDVMRRELVFDAKAKVHNTLRFTPCTLLSAFCHFLSFFAARHAASCCAGNPSPVMQA